MAFILNESLEQTLHHRKDQLGVLKLILLNPVQAFRYAHSYNVDVLVPLELLIRLTYHLIGIIDVSDLVASPGCGVQFTQIMQLAAGAEIGRAHV